MPPKHTPSKARGAGVDEAVVALLRATKEFTRAYDAYLHAPLDWAPARRVELDEVERRLSEAQHEVQRRELAIRGPERFEIGSGPKE